MIKRLLIVGIVFGSLIAGMIWFSYAFLPKMIATSIAGNRPPPTPVTVAQAISGDLPQSLGGIGTIQAVHQVTVAPEVAGRVTQIFFEPGAVVKAGDPLLQLNDQPERGDLANYEAQLRLGQATLKRSKELVGRYTPQQTVDQDQATVDQAAAGIAKTQAQIAQKLVRAPFGGQLGIRQADLGQYLNAGGAIVTLTDLDELYINFTVPEQNRARLAIGQTVQIRADAFPGRVFEAKLTTIEPQVAADTRTIKLQATLANPEHLLLPGMFANSSVVLPPQSGVVSVPETAVDYSLYGDSVFLVHEDGTGSDGKPQLKAARTFVKTGDRFNGRVAVLSGLKAGDQIVSSGQIKLAPDAVVTIATTDLLKIPAVPPIN